MSDSPTAPDRTRPTDRDDLPAVFADLAFILLFSIIGRSTHGESMEIYEVARTALPFWVGALIGHVIIRFMRRSPRTLGWGAFIVVATWTLGQAGRFLLQLTSEPTFLAVSAAFLTLFLLGWRVVLILVVRLRRRSRR
ncbi:MAG TPA: DUF3054 domain-containing protein [Actinomycetaceae bacterium]|nr:DUF3054 domain-containing protein [Actinomycetaceae bacterium]